MVLQNQFLLSTDTRLVHGIHTFLEDDVRITPIESPPDDDDVEDLTPSDANERPDPTPIRFYDYLADYTTRAGEPLFITIDRTASNLTVLIFLKTNAEAVRTLTRNLPTLLRTNFSDADAIATAFERARPSQSNVSDASSAYAATLRSTHEATSRRDRRGPAQRKRRPPAQSITFDEQSGEISNLSSPKKRSGTAVTYSQVTASQTSASPSGDMFATWAASAKSKVDETIKLRTIELNKKNDAMEDKINAIQSKVDNVSKTVATLKDDTVPGLTTAVNKLTEDFKSLNDGMAGNLATACQNVMVSDAMKKLIEESVREAQLDVPAKTPQEMEYELERSKRKLSVLESAASQSAQGGSGGGAGN